VPAGACVPRGGRHFLLYLNKSIYRPLGAPAARRRAGSVGDRVSNPLPPLVAERLRALRERPIDPTEKGFGPLAAAGAARLAADRPALHAAGFTYPLLTLRESALANNIAAMAAYCDRAGVALAPHGKTAMSPELAARQLAHGAWGITVATVGQLRTYRAFGFPRLLLANELVDEAGIAWLAAELAADPGFEAYCYVDSTDGVAILDRVLGHLPARQPAGRRLGVLVEIGHAGGRTGCRTDAQALDVAKAAAATGTLRVAGVAGYEAGYEPGHEQSVGAGSQAAALRLIAAFCRRLRGLAVTLATASDSGAGSGSGFGDEFIVTAGGSAYFDVVTRELTAGGTAGMTVILRSGAYLTHDHGYYGTISPAHRDSRGSWDGADAPVLRPALELWAQVLSRPEPGLALLGAGRRDVGFDKGLPVPLRAVRQGVPTGVTGEVTELNDQHAYLRLDAETALAPGDLVCLGISHPCTTLDKWRVILVVDDDGHVIDTVHAFF
jgi:D-serine deaminase-like pyridoxal phosphate-dependent protein